MATVAWILFGAGATVAASWAAGSVLLAVIGLHLHRYERFPAAFLAGAPCLSTAIFALASLGLARKSVFLVLAGIFLAAAWKWGRIAQHPEQPTPLPRPWLVIFAFGFAIFTWLYFFNALKPELSPDGATYRLGILSRYDRWHGFRPITTDMYASLSMGVEMLMLMAFSIGRHSAAAMTHFAFLLSLPWLIVASARRADHPVSGLAAALLVYLAPVAGIAGTSAYNDVAVAAIVFAVFYFLQLWRQQENPRIAIVIGLVAGFAYAAKYTAFVAVPYALAAILWRRRRRAAPELALACVAALLVAGPWALKNAIWIGNPVAPFFNRWFPNPYVTVSFEEGYRRDMRSYQGVEYKTIPWDLTVSGERLAGSVGPVFLLAPLALLAFRFPEGRRWLLAAAVFGATYFTNIGARFVLPALPFISLSMALVLERIPLALPVLVLAHGFSSWPGYLRRYSNPSWALERGVPIQAALRLIPEEQYLTEKSADYVCARMIDEFVPPGSRVFAFNLGAEAYLTRDVIVGYKSALGNQLMETFWTPLLADWQATRIHGFRFPKSRIRWLRLTQTATKPDDQWSLNEVRIFLGGKEIPRDPAWRFRASPFPWWIQSAFDNALLTRWRSGRGLEPGMFVEMAFPKAVEIDSLTMEVPSDQHFAKVYLEAGTDQGTTFRLDQRTIDRTVAPSPAQRRQAMAGIASAGVDYLFLMESDMGADDVQAHPRRWGLAAIAERGPGRLYRIAVSPRVDPSWAGLAGVEPARNQ